jgi:hypothetical protein
MIQVGITMDFNGCSWFANWRKASLGENRRLLCYGREIHRFSSTSGFVPNLMHDPRIFFFSKQKMGLPSGNLT